MVTGSLPALLTCMSGRTESERERGICSPEMSHRNHRLLKISIRKMARSTFQRFNVLTIVVALRSGVWITVGFGRTDESPTFRNEVKLKIKNSTKD